MGRRYRFGPVLGLLALTAAGCGGSTSAETPKTVSFRASDGVRLEGKLFGDGDTAVVLSHMGRGGDTQADWYGVARRLAREGYLALTYDRRGVCPRGGDGCSAGVDDYETSWKDVVGAYRFVRARGAQRVVFAGASIGAMASVYAAALEPVRVAGLVEIGGINHASGYDFNKAQLARIEGAKLFVSSRGDVYGGADAAREWHRWATPPKRLEILPGSEHGTDMLRPSQKTAGPLTDLLLSFVDGLGA
jgi:pimeloyl-ACP methyl ester carboxylesterase